LAAVKLSCVAAIALLPRYSQMTAASSTLEIDLLRQRIRELETELAKLRIEAQPSETAERERSRTLQFLQSVLDQMPAGVIIAEAPSGKLILSNELASEILGGNPPLPLDRVLEQGETIEHQEVEVLRGDGMRIDIAFSAAPVLDTQGRTAAATAVFYEITSRKRSEAAARQMNESLQQFAYTVSHDLQEPLRTVSVFSQLLLRRHSATLAPDIVDSLRLIHESSGRMGVLLQDLLAYCRAVDQQAPARLVDCRLCFDRALSNLAEPIKESGAQFEIGSLPVAVGHEHHFIQLFQNLVSNAIKYRSGEIPVITISAEFRQEAWCFAVTDNGIGIPPEYRERIFGVFKRLHGYDIPGTGIGLAICARIVAHYGGRIWVSDSPSGKGVTFSFSIPASTGPA
jgi:signal transduction histidine kinase